MDPIGSMGGGDPAELVDLPSTLLREVGALDGLLSSPVVKSLIPIPILAAIAVPVYFFFRGTWKELDREATEYRAELAARDEYDLRPAACLLIAAVVLTFQEYYGNQGFYRKVFKPLLVGIPMLRVEHYDELYGYLWWVFARVIGYVLVPFPLWKLLFPKDSLLDLGLRTKGFLSHVWIYGACLAIVVPVVLLMATQPDFGSYYPFYKASSRSWHDFLTWEAFYFLQFFGLEMFFRGWMVGVLRKSLGSAAIFAMTVPYCMIHYGKPYLEANGAIVAGIVLGSLSLRTRSIYAGFLAHVTVAALMDWLALWKRGALPDTFWAR